MDAGMRQGYVQRASVHHFFFLVQTEQPWFVIDDTSFSPKRSVSLPTLIIPEINYRRQMHLRYCAGALGSTSDTPDTPRIELLFRKDTL